MVNWVDVISVAVWGACALTGFAAGFMRVWVLLVFLLAGMGFAGGLAPDIGPAAFGFIEKESSQTVAGFFLIFGLMLLMGAVITRLIRRPLSAMSGAMTILPAGMLFNRFGGLLAGLIFGCAFLAIILMGLQQYPVNAVGRAVSDSSFAAKPIGWVDNYVATLEFSSGQ